VVINPNKENIMPSSQEFVEFVAEQIVEAGAIVYKKMFGEYALYCDGKVIALVCDDQLFVKPTEGGKAFIGNVVEAAPYPGAKPNYLLVDQLEDRAWMSALIRITAAELPIPKPKKKKLKESKK
jgi:TfoX/Sxy family transcriptional regulator of competence genes